MNTHDHAAVEAAARERWRESDAFRTPDPKDRVTTYILDFFPYPSGSGLHVGHVLPYVGTDVMARAARMRGEAVLHPMGWDAFGLPAENYALKTGVPPAVSTTENTANYRRQMDAVGLSYDWSRMISTADPAYYRWTQWLFGLLYRRGLAYRKEGRVNWCEHDQTVLANEQVIGGLCDRCGNPVVQRELTQWYFRITDYAQRLLDGLDAVDWPEGIKAMQRSWIGRSEGAELTFAVEGSLERIAVYTTRPDTLYGVTYVVLAPEHPLLPSLTTNAHRKEVEEYRRRADGRTELDRTGTAEDTAGAFTGSYAVHPLTGGLLPIWTADYVLAGYGTGAVMAVPAHDERDHRFAAVHGLPTIQVVESAALPAAARGTLRGSGRWTGRQSAEAAREMAEAAGGTWKTVHRLRDWLVSRQRYWGVPIPVLHGPKGEEELVPEAELPVLLPEDVEFRPKGESPLAAAKEWREVPRPDGTWLREADTLDTFVCSSWYFLRFVSPHAVDVPFRRADVEAWLPVDLYVGGAEHAVLHLLYARFITMVLHDEGLLPFSEPFAVLRNQGTVLGPDGRKMSKSKGNVVNPDEVIAMHGADTLRVYELFMGPFDAAKPWDDRGILGAKRFLERVIKLIGGPDGGVAGTIELRSINRAALRVTGAIAGMKFNVALAALMECANELSEGGTPSAATRSMYVRLLSPFAPHLCEALWTELGGSGPCTLAEWPYGDADLAADANTEFAVQVDGKVRATLSLPAGTAEADAVAAARLAVATRLLGREVMKEVFVPGRLVSFATKPVAETGFNR